MWSCSGAWRWCCRCSSSWPWSTRRSFRRCHTSWNLVRSSQIEKILPVFFKSAFQRKKNKFRAKILENGTQLCKRGQIYVFTQNSQHPESLNVNPRQLHPQFPCSHLCRVAICSVHFWPLKTKSSNLKRSITISTFFALKVKLYIVTGKVSKHLFSFEWI